MKKFLSVVLAASMLFSVGVLLSSCFVHECEFSDAWSASAEYHWRECTDKECLEFTDKAEHTWDAGKITTEATQNSDGVKTFTCTVCQKTKTEAVVYTSKTEDSAFTGMTEAEWNAAFAMENFQNFEYKDVSAVKGSGVTVDTETICRITSDCAWVKMTIAGSSEESYVSELDDTNELRESLVGSLKDMTPYEKFAYDAKTKTYKAKESVYVEAFDADTSNITLTFENGKIVKMEYEVAFVQSDISFTASVVITFSSYGNVVLE